MQVLAQNARLKLEVVTKYIIYLLPLFTTLRAVCPVLFFNFHRRDKVNITSREPISIESVV